MQVRQFNDGPTRCEVWEVPDGGWHDWSTAVDRFLTHAIRGITATYAGEPVEWLEVNYWQDSGRLIVFPSQQGPHGDRGERVYFELSSRHLEAAARQVSATVPDTRQEAALVALAQRVWRQVGKCFTSGAAGRELALARRAQRLRVAGYEYNPGEGPFRLSEDGTYRAERT